MSRCMGLHVICLLVKQLAEKIWHIQGGFSTQPPYLSVQGPSTTYTYGLWFSTNCFSYICLFRLQFQSLLFSSSLLLHTAQAPLSYSSFLALYWNKEGMIVVISCVTCLAWNCQWTCWQISAPILKDKCWTNLTQTVSSTFADSSSKQNYTIITAQTMKECKREQRPVQCRTSVLFEILFLTSTFVFSIRKT